MIKSQKPRGHSWTHASAFQRTTEFCTIDLEECRPHETKILVRDPDDGLPKHEREAKRRRIEKLANDFLEGRPLFIPSARPCPVTLTSRIVWKNRSSNAPKFTPPQLDFSDDTLALWEDVEDDPELLERLLRTQPPGKPVDTDVLPTVDQPVIPETIAEEQPQVGALRAKTFRSLHVSDRPSDEALRLAAALRARRHQGANSEAAIVSARSPNAERVVRNAGTPHTTESRKSTHQWLSRRQSRQFADLDPNEDSADELRLSRIETPLTPSRLPVARSRESSFQQFQAGGRISKTIDSQRPAPQSKPSFHTAPEYAEIQSNSPPADVPVADGDSHTRFLRSQGILAAPRRSWVSVNGPPDPTPAPTPVNIAPRSPVATSLIRKSVLDSAKTNASSIPKSKRTKSRGKQTPRQTSKSKRSNTSNTALDPDSAPHSCEGESPRPTYIEASGAKDDTTPFMFRKRTSDPRQNVGAQIATTMQEPGQSSRRTTYPPSDKTGVARRRDDRSQSLPGGPPMLDMSFDHDSSFAPRLNMALVDEHLNTRLPAAKEPSRRTSTIKRALRKELKEAGAEVSRCDSEPPPSSQVNDQCYVEGDSPQAQIGGDIDEEERITSEKQREPSQFWAGTQVLLNQAQKDLFSSPDKQDGLPDDATTQAHVNKPSRSSLDGSDAHRRLSYEPMPSTQALLGDFRGFSTVKKPHANVQNSPLPTPTARGKNVHAGKILEDSIDTLISTASVANKRIARSGLRCSVSSTESPAHSNSVTREDFSVRRRSTDATATNMGISTDGYSLSQLPPPQQSPWNTSKVGHNGEHADSFTPVSRLQSFQEPQWSFGLLRDDSNVDRTIDDLTRDVFDTADMSGVWSQGV